MVPWNRALKCLLFTFLQILKTNEVWTTSKETVQKHIANIFDIYFKEKYFQYYFFLNFCN